MTFQDIFRSSFLENVSAISVLDMALSILLAFALGLFIFYIYKKTYCWIMYSAGFGITLIALTLITTLLILAVTGNIILSLGMVGALSIVRFRTAIKEPKDIAFLFWSIAAESSLRPDFFLLYLAKMFIGLVLLVFSSRKTQTLIFLWYTVPAMKQKGRRFLNDQGTNESLRSQKQERLFWLY